MIISCSIPFVSSTNYIRYDHVPFHLSLLLIIFHMIISCSIPFVSSTNYIRYDHLMFHLYSICLLCLLIIFDMIISCSIPFVSSTNYIRYDSHAPFDTMIISCSIPFVSSNYILISYSIWSSHVPFHLSLLLIIFDMIISCSIPFVSSTNYIRYDHLMFHSICLFY